MFQLLPCSRCQRTFSVRSEVSDEALLKCPNCGNQFRLGELLDAFYAPWQVLENPGAIGGATSAQEASAQEARAQAAVAPRPIAASPAGLSVEDAVADTSASQDAELAIASDDAYGDHGLSLDGPELELADEDELTGTAITLDNGDKDKPKTDWSKFKPITHEEFQRMKRAERSPIWSTLQVVLGGAAAIPVSLLLLWHVLDKDVAGAGPAVARYVPWIVPQKFRGVAPVEAPDSDVESSSIPRRGESGFRNFDDVMPPAENGDGDSSEAAEADDAATEGDGAVVGTLAEKDDEPEATGDESAASQPQAASTETIPPESAATAEPPLGDVFALLNRTAQKVEEWPEVATAEDTVKRQAALSLFEDLASLGAHFSTIPDTPGAPALARDKAQEISRAIKRQPNLIGVLFSAAKAQVSGNLPRSKNGWVLVCTVGEIIEQGDAWRIMVADPALLPLDVPTIEIPKNVAPQLTSGQRLLLLGKFITPPSADTSVVTTEESEEPAPSPEIFRASFSYGL